MHRQLNPVCVGLGAARQLNGRVWRFGDIAHLLHAHAYRLKDVYLGLSIGGGVASDLLFKTLPVLVIVEHSIISIVDFCASEVISVWRSNVYHPALTSTNSENIDVRPNKGCK